MTQAAAAAISAATIADPADAGPAEGRDVRVDTIGFVGELYQPFDKDLRTAVKLKMVDRQLDRVAGDCFTGQLVTGGPVGTIEPRKWLRLYKTGKISEADFLAALSVSKERAKQVVSVRELDRLCDFAPAQPRLVVARIKGVEVTLAQALRELTKAAS